MRNIYGSSTPLIPISYADILVNLAMDKGATRQSLMAGTDIQSRLLTKPNVRISYDQYKVLIENALRETQEPRLGLFFGEKLNVHSHGVLGRAAQSSPNLWTALGLVLRFYKTRYPLLTLNFFIEGETAVIQAEEAIHLGSHYRFIMETSFSSLFSVSKQLTQETQILNNLSFKFNAPEYAHYYQEFFQAPAQFGQASNSARIPVQLLQREIDDFDPSVVRAATEQCSNELEPLAYQEGLITRVRQIMLHTPGYFPKLDEVARQLHTSSRTLRRRLQAAGISYQKILDDIRKEKALHYLMTGDQSIEEISVLLDYKDPSNFSRAFKKWTGRTPGSYRRVYSTQFYN